MRFEAGENEDGRRLDRVLKKTFPNSPLSFIYRIIRKDVKVNGRRASAETLLNAGDVIEVFLPDEQLEEMSRRRADAPTLKKQFKVVYEDENILVVDKPFGLLVHGDETEKKNTLTNQVISYLAESGGFLPGRTGTFVPAPVNRIDRNTTGLVIFGKNLPATRDLASMMRGREAGNPKIEKAYLTIVRGEVKDRMELRSRMVRESGKNISKALPEDAAKGVMMLTEVVPLSVGKGYTLIEAKLLTGRTHQIRVQLAEAGFPVIGDRKYGDDKVNRGVSGSYGLTAQLLHAYRLQVLSGEGRMEYIKGETFRAKPPERFAFIAEDLGCRMKLK